MTDVCPFCPKQLPWHLCCGANEAVEPPQYAIGWQCPVCDYVWAPQALECGHCGEPKLDEL